MKKNIIISIASGKGGTGKTTISTNLAYFLSEYKNKDIHLIDCDVEEPNDMLFFDIKPYEKKPIGIKVPVIDENICTYCGICSEVCEFNAIAIIKKAKKTFIAEDLCHGCGACSYFCPVNAITEKDNFIGEISFSKTKNLKITEGRLNISESMPTPILRELLKYIDNNKITILDAPPGTSCSMVTTIGKSDFVILVTEPTPFGVNDLKLAYEVVKDMNKKCGVIINKAQLGNNEIYDFLEKENIELLMEIPFDKHIAEVYSKGLKIIDEIPEIREKFEELYNKIINIHLGII